ncbi:MAG: aldo/keto reductase, partial [Candidatus Hermodarchaeota archaeon]
EMIPILGQGLWGISRRNGFIHDKTYYENIKSSIRKGISLGMTHLDTAEFYGLGKAEEVLGELIKEYSRDELFITSKLFPIHFSKKSMKKAANKSLKRLGLDHLDLYLVHWPSKFISIKKEMDVLEALVREGKTRYIGVSNFSVKQFKKAQESLKEEQLVNNQLHINITSQNHIHKSLPYYRKNDITVTAYSPLAHTGYTKLRGKTRDVLDELAAKYKCTIQQIAIAWLINHKNIISIPKAFSEEHVEYNAKAAQISLLQEDINRLYDF